MKRRAIWTSFALGLLVFSGCKSEEVDVSGDEEASQGDPCDPGADPEDPESGTPCAGGLACEPVGGTGDYACAQTIEIRGQVFDALDDSPLEGARVVVLDGGGAPISDVSTTDADGNYAAVVSVPRDENGDPIQGLAATLSCFADDYQNYPSGIRPSIPVDLDDVDTAGDGDGDGDTGGEGDTDGDAEELPPAVVDNPTTDVGMLPLPDDQTDGGTIFGTVEGEDRNGGTLVIVESGGRVAWTIADQSGDYRIFDVPTGSATVQGFRTGNQLAEASVDVEDGGEHEVNLTSTGEATSVVSGSVNIVNAPGGSLTSVVLVPAAVYNETLERGPVPFGLRAPEPGFEPDVSGGFSIAGVPDGTYKVLAAFENDALVRDPDESIAGTDIVEITVAGADQDVAEGFKVTEALEVISPGAEDPEQVSGTPTFVWVDDSSEDRYEIRVYSALGDEIWLEENVPGGNGGEVEVEYGGPPLENGMYYQFRVTSWKDSPQGASALSRTEDLRGVFFVGG